MASSLGCTVWGIFLLYFMINSSVYVPKVRLLNKKVETLLFAFNKNDQIAFLN